MKIILDAHMFLWCIADPERIESSRRVLIESFSNDVFISSASVAEMMIKASIGKLDVTFDPVDMIERSGFSKLDFSPEDALSLKETPFHHRDPFDRMLIAQSIVNGYHIMTGDTKFRRYDCRLV